VTEPWNVRWFLTRCVLQSQTSALGRRRFFILIAAANTRAPSSALTFVANGLTFSHKGECSDNAVLESFFGTMTTELGDPVWISRDAARAVIFKYIEVRCNRKRGHSTLDYVSPEQSQLPNAA